MNLLLVRHGETAYNRDGLGLGRADAPLTVLGQRQSIATAARLATEPVDRILTSPLTRAATIARALSAETGAPIEERDALIEMDVGETEGLTFPEMGTRFPGFLEEWRSDDPSKVAMPGGESLNDVAARLAPLTDELRLMAGDAAYRDATIVVVSHNFVLRVLICHLLNLPPQAFRAFTLDLASITTVTIGRERTLLRHLNNRRHLDSVE